MKKSKQSGPTLDLHGYKTDEVFDAVDQFLMKHQNKARVRIMTGKGKGLVQKTTLDYLKKAGYPWQYEKDDKGRVNSGVLIVFVD